MFGPIKHFVYAALAALLIYGAQGHLWAARLFSFAGFIMVGVWSLNLFSLHVVRVHTDVKALGKAHRRIAAPSGWRKVVHAVELTMSVAFVCASVMLGWWWAMSWWLIAFTQQYIHYALCMTTLFDEIERLYYGMDENEVNV